MTTELKPGDIAADMGDPFTTRLVRLVAYEPEAESWVVESLDGKSRGNVPAVELL